MIIYRLFNKNAMSFIELMVVVIVIGIMAAFVMPNYKYMRARAREKTDADNLSIVREALKLYKSRNPSGVPELNTTDEVNRTFKTGILANKNTEYKCGSTDPTGTGTSGYFCSAEDSNDDTWSLYFKWSDTLTDMNTLCTDDTSCPSCTTTGCPWTQ